MQLLYRPDGAGPKGWWALARRGSPGDDGHMDRPARTRRRLILLNGPPGAGKSTLAEALADRHRGLRALDVDVVKHALASWPSDPREAGLTAREQVLEQARTELEAGRSVIIGQYLARPEFPAALAELADQVSARFTHVVLELPAADLQRRLRSRRRAPTRPEQAANDAGVDPADAEQLIASVDALTCGVEGVLRLEASEDLAATLSRLERALDAE